MTAGACAALLVLGGCYRYVDAPPESVPAGAAVRARISAAEAERLSTVLLREDRVLEGELLESADGSLLLEVPSAVQAAGTSVRRLKQRVTVPRPEVLELQLRQLDPWKTSGAVAVLGAAIVYAGIHAFDAINDPSGDGGGKGGVDRSIEILLPFPIF